MFEIGGGKRGGGCLKEGGVYKLFLIIGGAFIGGRPLNEGGRLLEDLRSEQIHF